MVFVKNHTVLQLAPPRGTHVVRSRLDALNYCAVVSCRPLAYSIACSALVLTQHSDDVIKSGDAKLFWWRNPKRDATPLSVMDGRVVGRPVVYSDTGGMWELVSRRWGNMRAVRETDRQADRQRDVQTDRDRANVFAPQYTCLRITCIFMCENTDNGNHVIETQSTRTFYFYFHTQKIKHWPHQIYHCMFLKVDDKINVDGTIWLQLPI